MKTKTNFYKRLFVISLAFLLTISLFSQKRKSITVLNIDTHGLNYTPEQLGNLVRLELEKLDTFEVMDRYDVAYLVKKNNLDIANCYGKIGLVETGKTLNSKLMLSGSVELYGETIIITLRMVDVESSATIKSYVREYLNLPIELQTMIRISLHEMLGKSIDQVQLAQFTKVNNYENAINTPQTDRLNLSGPRLGIAVFTYEFRQILRASKNVGGFELYPQMMQFGYQFEQMYLNEGNFQALFEFIPMVTGIDQQTFIPSIALLNGVRHNLWGLEFALGPNFAISKKAEGYYNDTTHIFILKSQAPAGVKSSEFVTRADSRGDSHLSTTFVFAVGKTFKSGKMNFPVNLYVIPAKDGLQFGLSLGYNGKNKNSR
jgi:TolB-like protein